MAETVQVTKFKSLNGNIYDTEQTALLADEVWKKENTIDLAKEIALLEKQGTRLMEREKQKKSTDYINLVIQRKKHGDSYCLATTPEAIGKICFDIIKENKSLNYYHTVRDKIIIDEIINTNNAVAALSFIKNRSDQGFEYEGIEFESIVSY